MSESNLENVKKTNPLLERFNKMPPETFRIPSGGAFYTNGELDEEVTDGEVIIYPMTTQDEITMKSPDMLFQGSAIERVFKRCIPQVLKPMELLSNDVDFLMICLRIVTYGSSIELKYNCPKCREEKNESDDNFSVKNIRDTASVDDAESIIVNLSNFVSSAKPVDPSNSAFTVTLKTGEVVKLAPSRFKDMIKIYQFDADKMDTPEALAEWVYDAISSVIVSVNDHEDKDDIREWLSKCEAPVVDYLQAQITKTNDWGTTYKHKFTCSKCSHSEEITVPINPVELFTTPLTQET